MIWAITLLFLAMATQCFFIARLFKNDGERQQQLKTLTDVYNWNFKELEHRSEQTQMVKVVEL